jgi:hypothetical protein
MQQARNPNARPSRQCSRVVSGRVSAYGATPWQRPQMRTGAVRGAPPLNPSPREPLSARSVVIGVPDRC